MLRAAGLGLLITALTAPSVHAAPTTPDALDGPQPTDIEARAMPDRLRATEGATGPRTIDLLLDMQQRSAGVQFNERQRPTKPGNVTPRTRPSGIASAAARAVPAAASAAPGMRIEPPPTLPSALFGSGATPMLPSARAATVEPHGGAGTDAPPPRRSGVSPSGEPLPRWLLLPRELINYVRENRWLVLSSVAGGLLLIWGVSSLFARAAANAGRVPVSQAGRALNADRWSSARQEARPARRRSHRRPG